MKQLALLSFLFFSLSFFSQETENDMDLLSDTTWLNASRKKIQNKVGGRVFVSFVVDVEGNVVDVELLKTSLIDAFDEEALRVVRNIPKGSFIPGKRDGENVRFRYRMPINFKPSFLKQNNK